MRKLKVGRELNSAAVDGGNGHDFVLVDEQIFVDARRHDDLLANFPVDRLLQVHAIVAHIDRRRQSSPRRMELTAESNRC